MRVTRLKLANLRALETAEFHFQPGFNLIVGVNGVGKTTALDALRVCMSRILPSISASRANAISFAIDDIRTGFPFLDVELAFEVGRHEFRLTRRQWRQSFAVDDEANIKKLRRSILNSERLRDRARNLLRELAESHGVTDSDAFTPSEAELKTAAESAAIAPNCVYFSTNRSVASYANAAKSKTVGGISTAYAEALAPRPMYIAQFADWMRVQEALASEQGVAAGHLEVLQTAVARFLPAYGNLRPGTENPSRLVIDHSGITLDVSQLSDGERGVLALVLDLARRLSQANPTVDDPLKDGEAIVLIDEIDLHLHPKWQRQIVQNLSIVFPRCQFIATTHSPQVIGEVTHDRIQIIANDRVYSPTHSFGVDSSRVLEEIMDAPSRNAKVEGLLSQVNKAIGMLELEKARALLQRVINRMELGENDSDVIRLRMLIDFMDGNE